MCEHRWCPFCRLVEWLRLPVDLETADDPILIEITRQPAWQEESDDEL